MSFSEFYEVYWRHESSSLAGCNFALAERQAKLRKALVGLPTGASVLDAGCGSGVFCAFLTQLGYRVIGVDISFTAVTKAKAAVPTGHFKVASLEAGLPFAKGEFAAVWCTEVLEHLFDVHAALAELNRVLVQDGLMVLTAPYHGLLKNLAIALFGFERHYNPCLSHIRFYTRKSLRACLGRAGFAVLSWGGVGRKWPIWMSHFVIARKISMPGPTPGIVG